MNTDDVAQTELMKVAEEFGLSASEVVGLFLHKKSFKFWEYDHDTQRYCVLGGEVEMPQTTEAPVFREIGNTVGKLSDEDRESLLEALDEAWKSGNPVVSEHCVGDERGDSKRCHSVGIHKSKDGAHRLLGITFDAFTARRQVSI